MSAQEAIKIAHAAVSGLGLKEGHQTAEDVAQVIACLQAEAELYRRGYAMIGACDISNYLARCEEGGKVLEG